MLKITIRDRGCKIAQKDLDKVFKRLRQFNQMGIGLGFYTIK